MTTEENKKTLKRLSSIQRDLVESELYSIFQEVDFKDIVEQLRMLRNLKEDLIEIEQVLKTAKCCLQQVCSKKGFFCC